jgi:AcrR family transcriptional regulator
VLVQRQITQAGEVGALRTDARLNRVRILVAARDVFVELGPRAPLDEVARRAGTGIATLYRRFADRHALMRAVVLDALERARQEAHCALDEEPDPFAALVRYLHRVLDTRIAAVVPVLLEEVALDDEEVRLARDRSTRLAQGLLDAAHRAGSLRPEVTFGDLSLLMVRLSRPLPGGFTSALDSRLAHRHLELLISGLRPRADERAVSLPGPAMELDDLRNLQGPPRPADAETGKRRPAEPPTDDHDRTVRT